LGLVLGITGVILVVAGQNGIALGALSSFLTAAPLGGLAAASIALCGISFGTIYQKRSGGNGNVLVTSFIQHIGAAMAFGTVALLSESMQVQWTTTFVFSLSWLVLVMSIGAVGLLLMMIRFGEASRVAGIFFLVPPITALEAYIFLHETLTGLAILGLAVTAVAVTLVSGISIHATNRHEYKRVLDNA